MSCQANIEAIENVARECTSSGSARERDVLARDVLARDVLARECTSFGSGSALRELGAGMPDPNAEVLPEVSLATKAPRAVYNKDDISSEEEDGEWEAPLIDNPACKPPGGCGEWTPPKISNPDYKGKW